MQSQDSDGSHLVSWIIILSTCSWWSVVEQAVWSIILSCMDFSGTATPIPEFWIFLFFFLAFQKPEELSFAVDSGEIKIIPIPEIWFLLCFFFPRIYGGQPLLEERSELTPEAEWRKEWVSKTRRQRQTQHDMDTCPTNEAADLTPKTTHKAGVKWGGQSTISGISGCVRFFPL